MQTTQMQKQPKYLYKYYPPITKSYRLYIERILVHNEIYFSCPLDFNDPFDCRAYELIATDEAEKPHIKIVKNKMDDMLKDVIVVCLSETKDNILMWSHYSMGHRGFCLEFEITEGGLFERAEKVVYPEKNEYPKIYIYEEDEAIVKRMLLYKSKDWEYEQERRIFQYGVKSGNFRFPEKLLTGIIFGCQMSEVDKQQIRKWVKEGKCSPNFSQANKKENEFGLDILPINDEGKLNTPMSVIKQSSKTKKVDQQARKEIRIFKKFAKVAPYAFEIDTIKKEEPPKPDISCNLSDGTAIAFELVECIDESIAKMTYDSMNLESVCDDELDRLPEEKKAIFGERFKNALIYIAFVKDKSFAKKKSVIPNLLDYLLTFENNAEGKFNIFPSRSLRNTISWFSISRGEYIGPEFDVEAASWFADPAKERIANKYQKHYETKSTLELLVYYQLQPELHEEDWLPSVKEFIKNNIGKSLFQRVWIYSVTNNKIIFVYPKFEAVMDEEGLE